MKSLHYVIIAIFVFTYSLNSAYAWNPFSNPSKEATELLNKAESMVITNNYESARNNIESAILKIREKEDTAQDNPDILVEAGRLYIEIGDYKAANNIFDLVQGFNNEEVNKKISEICNQHAIDTLTEARQGLKTRDPKETHAIIANAIVLNQKNAPALLEAGKMYTAIKWYTQADNVFAAAVKYGDDEIKESISKTYRARAYAVLDRGDVNQTIKLFNKAHSIYEAHKIMDIDFLIIDALDALKNNRLKLATNYLDAAYLLNPQENGERISKLLYEEGCKSYSGVCIPVFRLAVKYTDAYKPKIAQMLYDYYNSSAVNGDDQIKIKKALADFLSKAEYVALFPPPEPDFIIYKPGRYTFNLESGETTKKWITFPRGRMTNFSLHSIDYKYIAIFYDGRTYNCWEIEQFPKMKHFKFKLKAVTDQHITMTVK